MARLVTLSEQEWLALGQPKDKVKAGFIAQHLALPRPFLDSWARNMTRLLGAARAAFPQASGPRAPYSCVPPLLVQPCRSAAAGAGMLYLLLWYTHMAAALQHCPWPRAEYPRMQPCHVTVEPAMRCIAHDLCVAACAPEFSMHSNGADMPAWLPHRRWW